MNPKKQLEHELGRYRKKVYDQGEELIALKTKLRAYEDGVKQVNQLVDAVLAAVGAQYGEADGEQGFLLRLKNKALEGILDAYEVHTERDDDSYRVHVVPKK